MERHLFYFRPGEEARMLARCQFGINEKGQCGALLTYPIKGYPWRRNVRKSLDFHLSVEEQATLFSEVWKLKTEYPEECLTVDDLWNDSSEKANGITRDRKTGKLCYTIGISGNRGSWHEYFSMREDSAALLNSFLYKTVSKLIAPYEQLA